MRQPNALGELVDEVCRVNGWSRQDVVRRSVERGGTLSKSNLGRLCSERPLPSISADRIMELSLALRVSSARVAAAAVRSMGFEVSESGLTTAEVVESDPALSGDTKAALLAILRNVRRLA